MTTFFAGLAVGVLVFALMLFAGRKEPTSHGQSIIGLFALLFAVIAMGAVWLIGALIWLFYDNAETAQAVFQIFS